MFPIRYCVSCVLKLDRGTLNRQRKRQTMTVNIYYQKKGATTLNQINPISQKRTSQFSFGHSVLRLGRQCIINGADTVHPGIL